MKFFFAPELNGNLEGGINFKTVLLHSNTRYIIGVSKYGNHFMKYAKNMISAAVFMISFLTVKAQNTDTAFVRKVKGHVIHSFSKNLAPNDIVSYKPFVIPTLMIAYGFTTLKSDGLVDLNEEIKEDSWAENPHKRLHIDNYLQFVPAAAVYGLNIAGIKGKNNFKDRSFLYLMSNLFLNVSVSSLKRITHVQRPDGTSYESFPSGHTAEAFASAEFLRQEYKDVSPWYGIAGYITATATAVLRIYNNKHWLSDVVTGAGIGIASTKLAYWIYPKIKKKLFKNKQMNTFVMPYYLSGSGGVSIVYTFHK